jgi:hypothetical protein
VSEVIPMWSTTLHPYGRRGLKHLPELRHRTKRYSYCECLCTSRDHYYLQGENLELEDDMFARGSQFVCLTIYLSHLTCTCFLVIRTVSSNQEVFSTVWLIWRASQSSSC